MADETLRSNLDSAFDPGPGYPDPLLLSRTMAVLQAQGATAARDGRWKGRERSRLSWPRTGLRLAAALLMVVLAIAAVGVYLVAHRALTQTVPAGLAPPRGTIAFVRADLNGNHLFTIRADGTGERQLLATTPLCCVRWSHKGDRLALGTSATPGGSELTAIVNADGSGYRVLPLDSSLSLSGGRWSPDDSRIAFKGFDVSNESFSNPLLNGIYTADTSDGGNLRRLTTPAAGLLDNPISYSPDGSRILFWRGAADNAVDGQLFLVDIDGTHLMQVSPPGMTVDLGTCGGCGRVGGPFGGGDPGGWSPDGSQISFAATSPIASDGGRSAVFVAAGDGTNAKRISDWGEDTTSARWSPTGDWIVFDKVNDAAGAHTLYLIRSDGSGIKAIPSGAAACCAVWSPDGNHLVFLKGSGDQALDLWTVNIDGSHLRRLTHTPAKLTDIGWSAAI